LVNGRSLKIKNQKGIETVLNYLPQTSFGVVVRRRDFVSLTLSSSPLFSLILLSHKKYCIKIAINISLLSSLNEINY
jgi:hypothetical protein